MTYGLTPGGQVDLLLVPDWQFRTAELASALKERIEVDKGGDALKRFRDKQQKVGASSFAHNHEEDVASKRHPG